ncbi:MAG: TNT domain-containing protein [Acidimicrobiales bacterium]
MRRARISALLAGPLLVVALASAPGTAEATTPCPTIADANASANPPGPALQPYLEGDYRLGPASLEAVGPVKEMLQGYDQLAGVSSSTFLACWWHGAIPSVSDPGYWYPKNDGFATFGGQPLKYKAVLTTGQVVDLFGSGRGQFLAPFNTPYAQRALPPTNLDTFDDHYPYNFHEYVVLKPFEVEAGPIADWFGQPGLGTQYFTDKTVAPGLPANPHVNNLVDAGYLAQITPIPLRFHPLDPTRIIDSRPGGVGPFTTPWGPGQTRDITVAGNAGVPANAEAVILNVTVTDTTAPSFLSVWPAGSTQPNVSSLNWVKGQTIANSVTTKLALAPNAGKLSIFNASGTADVIVDVAGYYVADHTAEGFTPLPPTRIEDSRPPGIGGFDTPWGPGETRDISVPGLPIDATAAVVNVTVTDTSADSHLTIWPFGGTQPVASTLNWSAGQTIANGATVKLGADHKLSIRNSSGTADVIVDLVGYYRTQGAQSFYAVPPTRVEDSRASGPPVGPYSTPWTAGLNRPVPLASPTSAGTALVPSWATSVVTNVTVTNTTAASFLTIYPTGEAQPLVSTLNWVPGQTIANGTTTSLAALQSTVYNSAGQTDVIMDVSGWFA